MDIMEITTMLGTLLGVLTPLGGLGVLMYRRQNKRLKESEAKLSEINVEKASLEFEKERVKHLHEIIENYNKTDVEHSRRISELNHALNVKEDELRDKTVQIRKLTEQGYKSEQEINRVQDLLNVANNRIIRLVEERDHYRNWKCYREDNETEEGCGRRKPKQPVPLKYVPLESDCENCPEKTFCDKRQETEITINLNK